MYNPLSVELIWIKAHSFPIYALEATNFPSHFAIFFYLALALAVITFGSQATWVVIEVVVVADTVA